MKIVLSISFLILVFAVVYTYFRIKTPSNINEDESINDIIAEGERRERNLYDHLVDCPVNEITGIVDSSGVGGHRSRGQEKWSLLLNFEVWRIGSGQLITNKLTIRKKVSHNELKEFQDLINAETIIRIKARVSEHNDFKSPQALLIEYISEDISDQELLNQLKELQKPVIYHDKTFGDFVLDRRVDWFIAKVNWEGIEIDLNLSAEDVDQLGPVLKVAHLLWQEQPIWSERIQQYAIEKLLPLKNSNWLDDGESKLSAGEFKKKMKIEAITIYQDGEYEFWHKDGELFFGHSIVIRGNISDGPFDADIPG